MVGEGAETEQAAEQHRGGKQLVHTPRHTQRNEQNGMQPIIIALADVADLIHQREHGIQRDQHEQRHEGADRDRTGQITVENLHAAFLQPLSSHPRL
jgi:hypothetical protein